MGETLEAALSLFRRREKHVLPTHAGDVHVPPVPGSLEEATLRLAAEEGFDLPSFLAEASSLFSSLRTALWDADVDTVGDLTLEPLRARLVRQAETSRTRARRLAVEGFSVLDVSLVRAPAGPSLALTVRVHYSTSAERLVHLTSGALFEDRGGSHHREDLTLVRVGDLWRASELSVLS